MKETIRNNRGQIVIAVITAFSAIVVAGFTSWAAASNRVSAAETKIEIIAEREANHYMEIQRQLSDINTMTAEILKRVK